MATVQPQAILEQLRWRYATKKFDASRKIPPDLWRAIEEAIVLAPSSYGLQPWKFLVIDTPSIRARLREASWNQPQITDASHLVVFCRRTSLDEAYVHRYVEHMARTRNQQPEQLTGFRDMVLGKVRSLSGLPPEAADTYTRTQTYIALGFGLASAAMLGVDACPMEGFDAARYDEILGLRDANLRATVVGAFGYRMHDDEVDPVRAAKVRFAHAEVVEHR
ncbi:MAG TPA: NAD(P)H-dependent oxidoreductase [Phycisphaerales bacterium]|nr:NAD(P)H-dependent oxidoreductase [Phycisphaerales bacterium]